MASQAGDGGAQAAVNLPTLRQFVQQLAGHLSSSNPPPAIFIFTPTNSSLALPVVQEILTRVEAQNAKLAKDQDADTPPSVEALLPKSAVVDLQQVHSTRQAFDRVLNQLSSWTASDGDAWDDARGAVVNWDGRTEGLGIVRKRRRAGHGASRPHKRQRRSNHASDQSSDESGMDPTAMAEDEDGEELVWSLAWDRSEAAVQEDVGPLRDSVEYFHKGLSDVIRLGHLVTADESENGLSEGSATRFVIFDQAERLPSLTGATGGGGSRDAGLSATFVATLLRLRDLARVPVTTIFISKLGFTKFRDGLVGIVEPIQLVFPDINDAAPGSKNDAVDSVGLLAARFAATRPTSPSLTSEQLVELFKALASVIWTTYSSLATDLDSLAYMTAKFWPRWLDCVENSNPRIAPTNIAALHQHLKADLARERDLVSGTRPTLAPISPSKTPSRKFAASDARVLNGFAGTLPDLPAPAVYLPDPVSPTKGSNTVDVFSADPITPLRKQALRILPDDSPSKARVEAVTLKSSQSLARSLPFVARYVLIAAYYASFNPAKSDVRHFVKIDETVAKKGKKGRRASPKKGAVTPKAKMSLELGGGKPFPLERLLAIFEAIVDQELEAVSQTIDVQMQITTLVSLRLLQRVSAADKVLDNVKLRCKVTKDTVEVLAASVGMKNWRDYLWDPEA